MDVFTVTLAIFILPAVFADKDTCASKGQCTALDGVTCVSRGTQRPEKCNTYTCKKSGNVLKYMVVKKLLKCERPDGTCMDRGVGEKNEERCIFETCRQKKNDDGTYILTYKERAYGCPMDDGTCLLFGKGNALRNKDKCTLTTCTKHRNKKGERTTTRLKEKYYGCPIDGVCKDKDVTRSADCTAYKCELSKGHTLMTWAVIQTGCQTDDGCKYNGDEWPDLDETSCVTRRCDVIYDKVKDMYTKSNNVARHGCRASNGTCYYDGETWPENDCYTWRCDISMTDEGRSMASSNIESGICQDADGSCKDYGETMRYWSGKTMLDCRCEKAISIKGFPYGNPICAIP